MNIKEEQKRVDSLQKLLDVYEQAERRLRVMKETEDFMNTLFWYTPRGSRYLHNMEITQAAKKRIEAAYINTLNS